MNLGVILGIAGAGVLLLVLLLSGLRVVHEHERAVVFRMGRLHRVRSPGLRWLLPLGIDRLQRVDVRILSIRVDSHDAITVDQVLARVIADVYFQVVNPQLAVTKVADYREATGHVAETQLRSVISKVALNDLLSSRELLSPAVTKVMDDETEPWGVRITNVDLKDVLLSDAMQRALARQVECERERQAKIAAAEGELQAARSLAEAAGTLAERPAALQLRYLQTLGEIGNGRSTVVVFPVPLDLMRAWLDFRGGAHNGRSEEQPPAEQEAYGRHLPPTAPPTSNGPSSSPARQPAQPEPAQQWPEWYRPR
jgi:regulator of protease activity HflC (stomatin/prohibitin superfamily)